jgi:DNA-binding GntR family transcriptional regulator
LFGIRSARPSRHTPTIEETAIASRVSALRKPFEDDDTPSTGLSRPTSSQQVADHIRRLIFENKLRVGDRVPQDEIAADLRVSRVPVREAVIALDREGWVVIEPHRGAFVVGLDENSTRDHYELLGRMYGFGARRAAERASEEGIAELAKVHRKLQAATDSHEFTGLNMEFLRRVVSLADSRRVSATVRLMAVSIVPGDFFAEVPDVMRIHKRGMKAIMRALKANDGDTAEREFVSMLRQEAESVVTLLTARGVIGENAAD